MRSSAETWRGELERALSSCVSVATLLGMRLRMRMRRVRMSCVIALCSPMMKTRSDSSICLAGSESGIRIGIVENFMSREGRRSQEWPNIPNGWTKLMFLPLISSDVSNLRV